MATQQQMSPDLLFDIKVTNDESIFRNDKRQENKSPPFSSRCVMLDTVELNNEIKSIVKTLKSKINSKPTKRGRMKTQNFTEADEPTPVEQRYGSLGRSSEKSFALAAGPPFNEKASDLTKISCSKLESKFL